MNQVELKKTLLSCPGDTIQETIDTISMSQAELAERLGRSVSKLNELIKGKVPVTKETATKLEYVLGVPASFWLGLERRYQDELLAIDKLEYLEKCVEWVKSFPLKSMKKMCLLPNTNNKSLLAERLLKFFRVASPDQWAEIYKGSSLAFKIELRHTAEPEAISVWLRLGELQSDQLNVAGFDKKLVRARLKEFRSICYLKKINWMDQLQELCAKCGIALVYTPSISKAPIYGASRWIKSNTTPIIQLSDRRKDYASFWFTFYHELGHILFHGKKEISIDGLDSIKPNNAKEEEADSFASRMLLTEAQRNELNKYFTFDRKLLIELSKKFHQDAGIIVSQLQRTGKIEYNTTQFQRLKTKVKFKEFKYTSCN